jgi:hypothetical protein
MCEVAPGAPEVGAGRVGDATVTASPPRSTVAGMSTRRLVAVCTAAALCALVLSACGSKANPGNGGGTPGPTGVLGTGGPATSAPPTTPPVSFPNTAEAYTKMAIDAWAAHDSTLLDQLEVGGGTLHTMAGCNGCYNTAFSLALGFCEGASGSSYCMYFNIYGDKLILKVQNQLLGQPQAIQVGGSSFEPTSFPSDDKAYATEALRAWIDGNDARLKLLTKNNLTSAQVDAKGPTRAPDWVYDHGEGAMGSVYFDFMRGGHTLGFQFLNGPPAPTTGTDSQHRIVDIIYLP